jgi:hypothetical protein
VLTNWVGPDDGAVEADPVDVRLDEPDRLTGTVLAESRRGGRLPMRVELTGPSLLFDEAGRGTTTATSTSDRSPSSARKISSEA